MAKKHLFLALSRKGWGETSLGLEVARQLRAGGDSITFLAHSGGLPALSGSGFEVSEVPDHIGSLFYLLLEDALSEGKFDSMVLCDFLTTNYTLNHFGVQPEAVLNYQLPVAAIDTWNYDQTGAVMDVFGLDQWQIGTWMNRIDLRLLPVPIGPLDAPGAYCGLPSTIPAGNAERAAARERFGIRESERAVLFCTARWQHELRDAPGQRLAGMLPQLLSIHLQSLGPSVRLVHVGPAPLDLEGSEGYLWLPPSNSEEFEHLLTAVDLLLSANISATTIGRALARGVPVVVVQNSYSANTWEELESLVAEPMSGVVKDWATRALPLFPFSLWPLGGWKFLRPLLRNNPYSEALVVVEALHSNAFLSVCREMLFDRAARERVLERQSGYSERVRQLPSAAALIGGRFK